MPKRVYVHSVARYPALQQCDDVRVSVGWRRLPRDRVCHALPRGFCLELPSHLETPRPRGEWVRLVVLTEAIALLGEA